MPIRLPLGDHVIGMISLEVHGRAPPGADFIWGDCRAALDVMASAAAPYLSSLPLGRKEVPVADSLAP